MLTIRDTRPDRNCQGLARREFLRVGALGWGALGLGGAALSDLLAAKAAAADVAQESASLVRDKAVVLLFLQGGSSHIEFFDPWGKSLANPTARQPGRSARSMRPSTCWPLCCTHCSTPANSA